MVNTDTFICEDTFVDIINESIVYQYEDDGIGSYEFHGTDYYDENLIPYLTTDDVMVQYTIDEEQGIYTLIKGCYEVDYDRHIYWTAELESVEWDSNKRCFTAQYSLHQE